MKAEHCLNCGSTELAKADVHWDSARLVLPVAGACPPVEVALVRWVCLACGYVAVFVRDDADLEHIREYACQPRQNQGKGVTVLKQLILLSVAGALGALSRYGLGGLVQRLAGVRFPWGTLAVNALGCFAFGLIWMLAEDRLLISGQTRFVLLMGFMGAFTTFSTFAFETGGLIRDSQWLLAAGNVLAHNGLGLIAVFLGMALGRLL